MVKDEETDYVRYQFCHSEAADLCLSGESPLDLIPLAGSRAGLWEGYLQACVRPERSLLQEENCQEKIKVSFQQVVNGNTDLLKAVAARNNAISDLLERSEETLELIDNMEINSVCPLSDEEYLNFSKSSQPWPDRLGLQIVRDLVKIRDQKQEESAGLALTMSDKELNRAIENLSEQIDLENQREGLKVDKEIGWVRKSKLDNQKKLLQTEIDIARKKFGPGN